MKKIPYAMLCYAVLCSVLIMVCRHTGSRFGPVTEEYLTSDTVWGSGQVTQAGTEDVNHFHFIILKQKDQKAIHVKSTLRPALPTTSRTKALLQRGYRGRDLSAAEQN